MDSILKFISVAKRFCEKIAQNKTQSVFGTIKYTTLYAGTSSPSTYYIEV
jgi:hypothetical protein